MIRKLPRDVEAGEASWFDAAAGAECPPPDLLTAALAGVLPEPIAEKVRRHAEACEACRLLGEVLTSDTTPEATDEEAARVRRRVSRSGMRPALWQLAAAAAIVLAIAGVLLVRAGFRSGSPASPAVPGSARGSDIQLVTPEFVLAIAKPPIMLPESSLVMRGGRVNPYDAALQNALIPFERNDFASAADKLREVAGRYPGRPHAVFYLGIALLLSDRPLPAITPLTDAARLGLDDPWLSDEAAWYRAVALERAGNPEGAVNALAPLCSGHGAHRKAACDGSRALTAQVPSGHREPGGSTRALPGR